VWKTTKPPVALDSFAADVEVPSRLGQWAFHRRDAVSDLVLPQRGDAICLGRVRWEFLAEESDLALGSNLVVVSEVPTLYLIWCLDTGSGIGVADVTAGTYDHAWYDIGAGRVWSFEAFLDGGDTWWEPPPGCPEEVLLVVARTGR